MTSPDTRLALALRDVIPFLRRLTQDELERLRDAVASELEWRDTEAFDACVERVVGGEVVWAALRIRVHGYRARRESDGTFVYAYPLCGRQRISPLRIVEVANILRWTAATEGKDLRPWWTSKRDVVTCPRCKWKANLDVPRRGVRKKGESE